eukprot:5091844-Prymnesium_polylepis.1
MIRDLPGPPGPRSRRASLDGRVSQVYHFARLPCREGRSGLHRAARRQRLRSGLCRRRQLKGGRQRVPTDSVLQEERVPIVKVEVRRLT